MEIFIIYNEIIYSFELKRLTNELKIIWYETSPFSPK
jgi:hypothetical protein